MYDELQFSEDLPQLAVDAFEIAGDLCGDCRNFHMLWPYVRIAGASGGDVGTPLYRSVLSRLLSKGGKRILIAGSADTGLLAVVARAGSSDTEITVLDRCETPLELCRRFASRWSLPIRTVHQDLTELAAQTSFDVVFVHMLLQFIRSDQQLEVLSRMRRSLRPDGRLVLAFRTSDHIEDAFVPDYRRGYAEHLIEQLDARKIPLPEPRDVFGRRIEIYAEQRRGRVGTHGSREEVEQLIETAGFAIEELIPIEGVISEPFRQFGSRIGLQRFLVKAKPRSEN